MWLEVPSVVSENYALVASNCECDNDNNSNLQLDYCRWCGVRSLGLIQNISLLL